MGRIRAIEVAPVGSLCRRLNDDEGVTLVEMMVAILILGIVLTALASTLVTSLASASRQEADLQANAVANAVVEDVRSLSFRNTALCETEATTVFGGLTFEGDVLVLLPDTDPVCTGPATSRALPSSSVDQDGRTYAVRLAIAWVDDDGDGLGSADPDTPQDYKRIVVDLTWQERGDTHTSRTEARRAPETLEQPMSVQVDPSVIRLRDEGDLDSSVTGRNGVPFEFRAVHVLKQSTVTVSWQDRVGNTDTAALASGDGGFTWSYTVPFNDGLFPNGQTLFTFTATDPSGVTTEAVTRALFLHDLEYLSVTGPTTVDVLPDGSVCSLPVAAEMRGMLLSDTLEVAFSHAPTTYALSGTAQTRNGTDYGISLGGTTGFPVTAQDITATLKADRVINPPASPIETSWTITLVPVAACP